MIHEIGFTTARPAIPASSERGDSRRRDGFSLVEVLVAIALFGVSMSAIAALTFAVTRQSTATVGTVERTAGLEGRVNDLLSIPWTALDARAGCTTVGGSFMPRTECIAVTTVTATRKRVTLTIVPADATIAATSVSVERTQPPAANPFKVQL